MRQEDELDKLEETIRILKNKYDQFFSGIIKMPPFTDRRNLEVFLHEFARQKIRDNGRRFRFNTLLAKYNQYREMWGRKIREREEGPLEFNRRRAALSEPSEAPSVSAPPARVTSGATDPYVKVVAAGSNGEDPIRTLYEQIQNEQNRLGKPAALTFEQLSEMVRKQSEIVRDRYNVNTVSFRVETVDGKVKLKAKPLQE